ncbi:carbon-nitrogen hydrolase family protein [Amaricoccus tamworthensis]|uniref:carbon-nitrogen hydrolase family protein n=1 Tax=Amaricoccus tamworthensis TaxID=57002 RepID=UPI003C7BC4A2
MRVGLTQLCSSDNPQANLTTTSSLIRDAVDRGAVMVLTPECTNLISMSRGLQHEVLTVEEEDVTLAAMRTLAADLKIHLLLGSLCLKAGGGDERFVNRSFLLAPDGSVKARYDKLHMFDVDLPSGESYRESSAYRPGTEAVLADAGPARMGLTICYDMRFPELYRQLAVACAEVITVPSAFTVPTGRAHWHTLLRARAIETGCFILAPAQSGEHGASRGKPRQTYGHSLVISPWGEVLADAGDTPNTVLVTDIDLGEVAKARQRIPSLTHSREFSVTLPA